MALARTIRAGVKVRLTSSNVVSILETLEALDDSRLKNKFFNLQAQATYLERTILDDGSRVRGVNGSGEDEVEECKPSRISLLERRFLQSYDR